MRDVCDPQQGGRTSSTRVHGEPAEPAVLSAMVETFNVAPCTKAFCWIAPDAGRRPQAEKASTGNHMDDFRLMRFVAGAGFEPATFGL